MVKQKKRKRSITSQLQVNVAKDPILDVKKTKLTNLVEASITFN